MRKVVRMFGSGRVMRENQVVAIVDGAPQVGLGLRESWLALHRGVVVVRNQDGKSTMRIVRVRNRQVLALARCDAVDGGGAALRNLADSGRPSLKKVLVQAAVVLTRRDGTALENNPNFEKAQKAMATWGRVNEILAQDYRGLTVQQFVEVPPSSDPDVLPQRPDQKALDRVLEERGFVPASKVYAQNRAAARKLEEQRALEAQRAKVAADAAGTNPTGKTAAKPATPESDAPEIAA